MIKTRTPSSYIQALAGFFAEGPSRKQLLEYRPPRSLQRRAVKLLEKQNEGNVTFEERQELEEFTYAERLMRLIKARLRGAPGNP